SMYRECREALQAEGIVVVPLTSSVRIEEGGILIPHEKKMQRIEGHAVLCRSYLITHMSGESISAQQEWPIVPENGRPFDKAAAAAATASLAYFLRDLLLLPRVEEGTDLDDDSRDKQPPPPPPKREPVKRSTLTVDQRIQGALDSLGINGDVARWHAVTRAAGVPPDVDELTEEQKREALEGLIEQYRARQAQ